MTTWATHPVTEKRFDDFADVINPHRRDTHCWCLSHRLRVKDITELGDASREDAARALARSRSTFGVVTYRDDLPVAWCHIAPRSEIPRLVASKLITPIDDVEVWSIICVVVRGGQRKRGVTARLIEGAVDYAASRGAPAVEAYPADPQGRMDLTMAFVGTRTMFERAGFEVVGETAAKASGMNRLVMRKTLA